MSTSAHAGDRATQAPAILGDAPAGPPRRVGAPAWHTETARALGCSIDVKAQYRNASVLKNGPVACNIAGNRFRLVVRINYRYRIVYVRFVGTQSMTRSTLKRSDVLETLEVFR